MTASPSFTRPLLIAVIGVALLTQGGCVWLRAKFANTAVYEDSEQGNPLEVPPDLDPPNTAAGIAIPAEVFGVSRSGGISSGLAWSLSS